MGVDQAPRDDDGDLERLQGEIVRETEAIEELRKRTRVIRAELAEWKPPSDHDKRRHIAASWWGGVVVGVFVMFSLGKLIAAVIGR